MSIARPLVTIHPIKDKEDKSATAKLPAVYSSPIRLDIVQFMHTQIAKNNRQPYAVYSEAGTQHSAASWGTGRAVARVPRVSGSGTHRAGQAAFANMCRKGRLAAPTKIMRKWHRKTNTNQKRYAIVSAIAASGITSLVLARGHRIENIPEVPLVVTDDLQSITTTKAAIKALEALGAKPDFDRALQSVKIRTGRGKSRNRRYVHRRSALIVYNEDKGLVKACRNLTGIETCNVDNLNLLQLAPGGHVGRFIIWTQSAFKRLDEIYGTFNALSLAKHNYKLPSNIMANADITRIVNSDEVQSVLRPKISLKTAVKPINPLKNRPAMKRLNPALNILKATAKSQQIQAKKKQVKKEKK